MLDSVSLPAERDWLAGALPATGLHMDRLLFCAKEATYKAWFPLTLRWLGFEDAHITFTVGDDDRSGTFHSELLIPGQATTGRAAAILRRALADHRRADPDRDRGRLMGREPALVDARAGWWWTRTAA